MSRRKVIALLINNTGLGDDYQGSLRWGVEQACRERDIDVWAYSGRTDWSPSGRIQRWIYELMDPSRVDGIVLAAGCVSSYAPLGQVVNIVQRQCPVPICSVGAICPGMSSIVVDNHVGVERLVRHFVLEHGRRQFAYIAGPADHGESRERLEATGRTLNGFGIELKADAIYHGEFARFSGQQAVKELLGRGVRFDALIAANDDIAAGALVALREAGLRCPEKVAVAGFDDAASAHFSEPPLTTVRQPMAHLGAMAVARIVQLWAGESVAARTVVPTELIVRESCGCDPSEITSTQAGGSSGSDSEAQGELTSALVPLFHDHEIAAGWANRLEAAALAEAKGEKGLIAEAFRSLTAELAHPRVPPHELQRIITTLRHSCRGRVDSAALEDAWHYARVLVGNNAFRNAGAQRLQNGYLFEEMRLSAGKFATSLTLESLQESISSQLPRLGVNNALVSLCFPDQPDQLTPLVYLQEGVVCDLGRKPYPAQLTIPDGAFELDRRYSLTILPLTFETEELGVAVLELSLELEVCALLREQISSGLKTVNLHQTSLKQERLRVLAQEEQRAANERLRSLSLIAGGVAHDLNNVLGPLVALPETIQGEVEQGKLTLSPRVVEDLETIRLGGERAAHTIRDLLSLGRPTEIPKSTVDLNRVLDHERRNIAGICAQDEAIAVEIETAQRPLVVRAAQAQLVRAILNLVINAANAIERSGRIWVRARQRVLTERLEGFEAIDAGHYGVVEVEDTGSGISPEHLPHLLEPFFTTGSRRGRSGTGLGLAIVHRVVKDSAGYVRVESQLGKGSTFSLFLPLEIGVERPTSDAPPRVTGGSERVLVVDDEVVQLKTARRILEHLGYSVVTARSGVEALESFNRELASPFDLVIVDLVMPSELNGIATIERVRERYPGQKALIASGCAPEQLDLEVSQGLAWIAKPYTLGGLAAAVRAALASS